MQVIASKAPRLNNPRTVSTVASAMGMSEQEVRSTLGDEQGLAWYAGPYPLPSSLPLFGKILIFSCLALLG